MEELMTWDEIKKMYPNTFVLLDNFKEKKKDSNKNIVIKGKVIFASTEGKKVYDEYRIKGKLSDMVFGYTGWKDLEIEEIPFMGLRFANS
ncbi:MAG: hypothetical protein ABIA04_15300 [Pseudomonadota bacterium]